MPRLLECILQITLFKNIFLEYIVIYTFYFLLGCSDYIQKQIWVIINW